MYMSVKKSKDTVGGQDVPGVIHRLESIAKEEKNLTRPYLCIVCIATPSQGKLLSYSDRQIRCNAEGNPYSLNCEHWGPGFIYPYITGYNAREIYLHGIKRVAEHLPFFTLIHRKECSAHDLGLLTENEKLLPEKFLAFCCSEENK